MRDRGDEEAALALGRGGGAERLAQRTGHATQRVAHLRHLAGASGHRVDRELAARDPLRVRRQPCEWPENPALQQADGEHEDGRERQQGGAGGDREARGPALVADEQGPGQAWQPDVRGGVVLADPALAVGSLGDRGQAGRDDLGC